MNKRLLTFFLAGSFVALSALAELPTRLQQSLLKRSEVKSTAVVRRAPSRAAEVVPEFKDIKFTYASISYTGIYESEDLFGDPVELGSYYLTLSTSKPDYLGYLVDEGIQIDIMLYNSVPDGEEIAVPDGEYVPAELFEETEGTFDTLFPEMTVNTKEVGSDELTQTIYSISDVGSINIAKSGTDGEFTITVNLEAYDDDYNEVAVTGSYTGKVSTYNDDMSRCDILPAKDYVMDIPNMRSSFAESTNQLRLEFYGTPMKSQTDRPGAAEFPCGAGDYFNAILQLAGKPTADSFVATYSCGSSVGSFAEGFWNYSDVNNIGVANGTYLAVYNEEVRAAYGFANNGTIEISKTDAEGVYNFTINVEAENGAKMTGSWRGKINGTAVPDGSGIDGVVADESEAPVEYYNLQGIKVDNPVGGMFIERRGNTVVKVMK